MMSKTYYARKLSASRLKQAYDIATPRVSQYLQAEIEHVVGFVQPGIRLLELGCGYGRVLAPLAKIAGNSYGIDNAIASLMLGRIEYPSLQFLLMDVGHLSFSPDSFDLVIGIQNFISACKVPPKQVIRECMRVTRSGGRILFSSYAAQFWPYRLEWFRQQADQGLIGAIDEEATGKGVIKGRDGFCATTFSPEQFAMLADEFGVSSSVYTVDQSSLFWEIAVA